MKCIILCAGYATRLYPLTRNTPKHLLIVKDKTILDNVIQKIPTHTVEHIYVVTNQKFYQNFVDWKHGLDGHATITVLNDFTTSNNDRLGSIGDVAYVIDQMNIDDDILLMSGDNLFNFSIAPLLKIFREGKNVIALYDVKTKEEARKMGIPTLNANGKIIGLIEKPKNPKSTLVSIGIYIFHKPVLKLLKQYLDEKNSPDRVGDFISWLCQKTDIYTYNYDASDDIWLDIGTPSQLALANEIYQPKA